MEYPWETVIRRSIFWSENLVLFAGLMWRLWVTLCEKAPLHPDQIFQTLEPSMGILHGSFIRAWEWVEGIRSWSIPAIYALPIRIAEKYFSDLPGHNWFIPRLFTFFLGTAALFLWVKWMRKQPLKPIQRLFWIVVLLISPALVEGFGATLSDTLLLHFGWIWIALYLEKLHQGKNPTGLWFRAGFFLAALLWLRIQAAPWVLGIGCGVIWRNHPFWKHRILPFIGGGIIAVAASGVLDKITWGFWFHSSIHNLKRNLLDGVASFYGEHSPWFYLATGIEALGIFVIPLGILGLFKALRKNPRPELRSLALATLLMIGTHLCIAHKEERFIWICFPALVFFAAQISSYIHEVYGERFSFKLSWAAVVIVSFSIAWPLYQHYRKDRYQRSFYTFDLPLQIKSDPIFIQQKCIYLIGHSFTGTYGTLLLENPHHLRTWQPEKGQPRPQENCTNTLVKKDWLEEIKNKFDWPNEYNVKPMGEDAYTVWLQIK